MEHITNNSAGASTDERASPATPETADGDARPTGPPEFATRAEADAYWAGVRHGLGSIAAEDGPGEAGGPGSGAEIRDCSGHRLRSDGWLPWKKARYLDELAAGAAVADACQTVGMSVTSAYALRNRRSGRAFARMWDSIMIHRARCRLADNNLSRAINGYAERIVKDGVVVAERHRFDNRLSMAMLTRLDRLAEARTGEEAELLRALSEDFEEYLEVLATGGDEDAFVEARRPPPAEPETAEGERLWYVKDELDHIAAAAGTCQWRHVDPPDIPVGDLDPDRMDDWGLDGWIRAIRSHYLDWLELHWNSGEPLPDGPDCPAAYDRIRRDIMAAMAPGAEDGQANSSPESRGEGDQATPGGWVPGASEEPLHPTSCGTPYPADPGSNDG